MIAYHEQGVVSPGGDDSDFDPVLGVPTGETVEHVNVFSGVQVVDSSFTVDLESVLATSRKANDERHVRTAKLCSQTHSIGMLTLPHQMSSLLPSSKTIRLSLGLRPVFFPEKLMRAPVEERTAPSFMMASSYKAATGALRLMWILSMSKPAWEKYWMSLPRTIKERRW